MRLYQSSKEKQLYSVIAIPRERSARSTRDHGQQRKRKGMSPLFSDTRRYSKTSETLLPLYSIHGSNRKPSAATRRGPGPIKAVIAEAITTFWAEGLTYFQRSGIHYKISLLARSQKYVGGQFVRHLSRVAFIPERLSSPNSLAYVAPPIAE
ncbi:hypothetical protein EVAR_85411_1 [Eumeta japonica]|uniref:Uncharacterized protein n=1 Tax=Eumeta variegata TaxID=151549 RepID=A0A4C1WK26_EUMVA|nr:hypothetical protein EVAR_85411_1 [Eumeta japonica]